MSAVYDILSAKFTGEILDEEITASDLRRAEKRLGRKIPRELSELLLAANGLTFDPPIQFRGTELLSFYSLAGIERTVEIIGEFIPPFLLPFARSFAVEYCLERGDDPMVYELSGIGDPNPRIVAEPTLLSLEMFCEALESGEA